MYVEKNYTYEKYSFISLFDIYVQFYFTYKKELHMTSISLMII